MAVRVEVVVELAEEEAGDELRALDEVDDVDVDVDETESELEAELVADPGVEVAMLVASVPSNAVANTSVPFSPALVAMVVARAVAS